MLVFFNYWFLQIILNKLINIHLKWGIGFYFHKCIKDTIIRTLEFSFFFLPTHIYYLSWNIFLRSYYLPSLILSFSSFSSLSNLFLAFFLKLYQYILDNATSIQFKLRVLYWYHYWHIQDDIWSDTCCMIPPRSSTMILPPFLANS